MAGTFRAILLEKGEGAPSRRIAELTDADLMHGDVTVAVSHSTINYKDGLALTGAAPVVRRWPMIPGIDFAGTVERCDTGQWQAGDKVLLTGWGYGEGKFGGLAQMARVQGEQPMLG